jgi:serine/threonine protein kinase
MGQVYLACSPGGRAVAIKVIRPDLAEKRGFRARFAREVAAARGVSGMYTAAVVDADPDAQLPWMATAYVEGPSLADAVEEHGPLPPEAVLSLAAGLAEGLQAIHRAGLVHRDLKPSNVLLASDGPRVIDFGISWAGEGVRLTDDGMTVGSPGYLSPEQARGREVDEASDVFSLGAVLAYAATGEGPFGDGPDQALMYRVVHEPPELSRVPDELRWLIESCLAKKPGYRPTVGQLLDRLIVPEAGADEAGITRSGAREPVVPLTGDRLPARYGAVPDTPSSAYTSVDMTPPSPEPAEHDRERTARRLWLMLAATAACVAVAAGAVVMALASPSGSPVPGPVSPPALVVPTMAGTTAGGNASSAPPAGPSHAATPPASPATPPATTPSAVKTAGGNASSAPSSASPGPSSAPPASPPGSVPSTSAGPTAKPPAPSATSSSCFLFICS